MRVISLVLIALGYNGWYGTWGAFNYFPRSHSSLSYVESPEHTEFFEREEPSIAETRTMFELNSPPVLAGSSSYSDTEWSSPTYGSNIARHGTPRYSKAPSDDMTQLKRFERKNPRAAQLMKTYQLEFKVDFASAIKPLSQRTSAKWKLISREFDSLPDYQRNALKAHMTFQACNKPESERHFSVLLWNMERIKQENQIWWDQREIDRWEAEGLDWKTMARLGDLLGFSLPLSKRDLPPSYIKKKSQEFLSAYGSVRWKSNRPSDRETLQDILSDLPKPREVEVLRSIRWTDYGRLYDIRVKEFTNQMG